VLSFTTKALKSTIKYVPRLIPINMEYDEEHNVALLCKTASKHTSGVDA
jgi:hypothetical protein